MFLVYAGEEKHLVCWVCPDAFPCSTLSPVLLAPKRKQRWKPSVHLLTSSQQRGRSVQPVAHLVNCLGKGKLVSESVAERWIVL